jgi:nickel/cobalt transporter (NicO) family protein
MLKRVLAPAIMLAALCVAASAQSSLGIGASEVAPTPGAGGLFAWIYAEQQQFFRALQGALRDVRDEGWGAAFGLIGLSFAYGIFHAAGPGHGKAVISSYMLANDLALKRGIALSFLSSMAQAVSALLLVGAGYLVLRGAALSMTDAAWFLEMASYAMIALIGGVMLWRKLAGSGGHGHHHHAHHDHAHHDHAHHGHAQHDHAHHDHGACETCGHSHAPDPALLPDGPVSIKAAAGIIAAVGIRPCTGAIVVLSFALLNGLYAAGVASVLAMALGTAITVSALAAIAVHGKGLATRLAGVNGSRVAHAIEILGAVAVLLIGLGLLQAGLSA